MAWWWKALMSEKERFKAAGAAMRVCPWGEFAYRADCWCDGEAAGKECEVDMTCIMSLQGGRGVRRRRRRVVWCRAVDACSGGGGDGGEKRRCASNASVGCGCPCGSAILTHDGRRFSPRRIALASPSL